MVKIIEQTEEELREMEMHAHNASILPNAVKLAEAYEKSGEKEFTVKKLYIE